MRILFTSWAWPSHLHAMVPLAWACRTAGHEVLVASQPGLTDAISRTGLTAAPVGHDVDPLSVFRSVALPAPGAGSAPVARGPRVLGLLVSLAESMVDELIALGGRWGADLIVFEPTAFAGPLAAAALGIPAIRHLYGTDLMRAAAGFLPNALAPLCAKLGLDRVDAFGVATVDPCPAGLQVSEVGSPRLPMRYLPDTCGRVLPTRPPTRTRRPQVCVTWGTTLSRLAPELFLVSDIVRAIGDLGVDLLLAVTPGQRRLLSGDASTARVVDSAPLSALLPDCDAVIAHGGAGSLLTAAAAGLPQLLVPRLPDHGRHAGRIAEAGAGIVVPAPVDDFGIIRDSLAELLATPAFGEAARGLRAEMAAQPSPAQVADQIERLVTRRSIVPLDRK